MSTFWIFFLFALGLACIIKGGDWFVDAAAWIARVSGIPQFIIGATIVSLATTLPEVLVSAMAAAEGSVAMATGNAIGSVTANTGMILAISIIFMPVAVDRKKYLPKSLIFLGAVALLWALSLPGKITLIASAALIAVFVFFIFVNIKEARAELGANDRSTEKPTKKEIVKNIALFIIGAAGIVIGSRLLVDNGTLIATDILHIDERIVSLTMVAIGTSLPELVTTITAIVKKQSSLSVGNIVGANIIDILLILPICSFIFGGSLPVEAGTIRVDIPICFAMAVITIVPMLITKRFRRWQGIVALAGYVGYIGYICLT